MKRFAEQFKKQSGTVKLRAAERRELKERLVSYMEYHPLPKTMASPVAAEQIESEAFTLFDLRRFNTFENRSFFGAFAVLLLIVVPVVAEKSVPGDVLYPVKVNFNEELRSSLTVSPYAKLEWETERLNRRIAEARLLASEGKLTQEVEAGVAAAVKQHSDAAQEEIATLRESDQDEAAIAEIAFESALIVQAEVLEKELAKEVEAEASGEAVVPGRSVAILASAIADAKETATQNQSGVTPSYEKLAFKIEQETTRAYELFESIEGAASAEEIVDIERRLVDIERKIAEATALHTSEAEVSIAVETGSSTEAVVVLPEVAMLRAALSDLQKLIRFMTDIDVRASVTVEELVPVTLTEEEWQDAYTNTQQKFATTYAELQARLEGTVPTEKMALGLEEIDRLASSTAAAAAVENYQGAIASLEEAFEYLRDLLAMTEANTGSSTPPVAPTVSSTEATASSTDSESPDFEAVSTTTVEQASTTDDAVKEEG